MPAVVRGGRRQAPKSPENHQTTRQAGGRSGAAKTGGKSGGAKSRSAAGVSKYKGLGTVAMPGEVTAWLAVAVIAGLLSVVLLTNNRAQAVGHFFVTFADERIASIGLNLQNVRLVNVSDQATPDVKKALQFTKGQPLALMDLTAVQKAVENVGWVKSATVRRQFPGLLIINVVERPRLAVWQYHGKETVIDDTGQIIPEAVSTRFSDLPLVVGEGANEAAPDIIELVRARPDLWQKTYALQRIDTRRWNILLKNSTVIKLPAINQEQAMARLDALMAQQRVLDQGLAAIDLLDPNALVVVPLEAHPQTPAPTPETPKSDSQTHT